MVKWIYTYRLYITVIIPIILVRGVLDFPQHYIAGATFVCIALLLVIVILYVTRKIDGTLYNKTVLAILITIVLGSILYAIVVKIFAQIHFLDVIMKGMAFLIRYKLLSS